MPPFPPFKITARRTARPRQVRGSPVTGRAAGRGMVFAERLILCIAAARTGVGESAGDRTGWGTRTGVVS